MRVRQQSGLTLIGFIIVIAMTLFIVFVGMKIAPMYLDNMTVASAMKEIASERGIARKTPYQIRVKFYTLMNINGIDHIEESAIKMVRGNPSRMTVKYELRKNIIGNLDVVVLFDKTVPLSE